MNWKLKAHALAVLSRLPAGRSLYCWLQRLAGTNVVRAERDLGRAYELLDLIHASGRSLAGTTCVEVGAGWHPFVPFVLALAGAKRVKTIDVNPWLSLTSAVQTWQSLETHLEEIAARTGATESEVRSRYESAPPAPRNLAELLGPLKIDYVYPGDARATGLASASVDVVLSSNVLEHIPLEIQTEIHLESLRILKPGGLAVHRFNPQDHYSTVDGRITNGNFLRFSAEEWRWLGGSGLAYHNRLRGRDYRELFERLGFELCVCRERLDERTLEAIRSGELPIAREFLSYTPEELSVDYLWVACRKPFLTPPAHESGGLSASSIVPLRSAAASV